jgi:hypothetical protein
MLIMDEESFQPHELLQEPFTKCLTFDKMIINESIHLLVHLFIYTCMQHIWICQMLQDMLRRRFCYDPWVHGARACGSKLLRWPQDISMLNPA